MRESCGCGAGIHTLFYKRAYLWRMTHKCQIETPQIELNSNTSFPVGFSIEEEEHEEEDKTAKEKP